MREERRSTRAAAPSRGPGASAPGLAWLIVLAAASLARAQPPLTLAELERMAIERHPTLAQAAADIDTARGRARQAGTLPNPVVGYTAEEVSGGPIIRGGEHGFFVEQTIPLGGKLKLSRQVFEQQALEAEARADVQRTRVLTDVRVLYHRALVAARRIEAREQLAALATEAVAVSKQLMNVGAADRPDQLDIEIEEQEARLRLGEAQQAQARVWRELGVAAGDPDLAPRPLDDDRSKALLPALTDEAALSRLLGGSPELAEARAARERASLALKRARREPVPDLRLRGGPRYNRELLEQGPRSPVPVGWEAAFEAGVTLPLFDRNKGDIAAAQSTLLRADAELTRLTLALRARLADALERYHNASHTASTYRDEVLPRAEEAHRLHLAKYKEMAAAYPQVLIARRTFVQATERYLDALDAAWRASAEIEGFLLTGGLEGRGRADF
jgi:outer membrane protein, heavy metal efflux system